MMKRFLYVTIMLCSTAALFSGCKKYLNIVPVDNLTGNNFWQTKKDVEAYTSGIYRQFRDKVAGTSAGGFYTAFDLRSSPVISTKSYITHLANNNIRGLQASTDWPAGGGGEGYRFANLTDWNGFYNMIQAANILYVQCDKIPDPSFSESDKKSYRAEAVFLRNLAYFFMVRLYGDVPYYTKAYNTEPLGRMPMVQVLNNCIEDMAKVKEDLPWTYNDPSIVGIRAMRGGAIALMMHMNMWAAGFDQGNSKKYYTAVATLGKELMEDNQGSYELLPLERTKEIFKGRTKEGLFEVLQNSNYGEFFAIQSSLANLMTYYPYRGNVSIVTSNAYYEKKYMEQLYASNGTDKRLSLWFDQPTSTTGKFQFLKFINVYGGEGVSIRNDDNIIVFRYSDAILLAAEAAAELNEDGEAQRLVNIVGGRAGALPIISTGNTLKDDIYLERCRELMGEGHYYNDLVRTKRILNEKFNYHVMSVSDFNEGAWTWPIFAAAMKNNPYMRLNDFWK